jgi:hypothetical protein
MQSAGEEGATRSVFDVELYCDGVKLIADCCHRVEGYGTGSRPRSDPLVEEDRTCPLRRPKIEASPMWNGLV